MERAADKNDDQRRSLGSAERDIVALGMAVAALILFVASLLPYGRKHRDRAGATSQG